MIDGRAWRRHFNNASATPRQLISPLASPLSCRHFAPPCHYFAMGLIAERWAMLERMPLSSSDAFCVIGLIALVFIAGDWRDISPVACRLVYPRATKFHDLY